MFRRSHPALKLTIANINPSLIKAEYAVRGPIVARSEEIKEDLAAKRGNYPFKTVISCNIGNPQALKQPPLSFYREVLSLCVNPALVQSDKLETLRKSGLYQKESIDRAIEYLAEIGHWTATGAYTASKGYPFARKRIAKWMEARDADAKYNAPVHFEELTLTQGASPGIAMVLSALSHAGSVMIPIPQYPLYTATLALQETPAVPYYLQESAGWGFDLKGMKEAFQKATKEHGKPPAALVAINPGNPTGQVNSVEEMKALVQFCYDNDLVLLADEVYQENIYTAGKKFRSYREVLLSFEDKAVREGVQLASFHSTSKGVIGECGRRGGFMHLMNFPKDVVAQFDKYQSIQLCPNVDGQIMTTLMIDPPPAGSAADAQFQAEYNTIMESYKRKGKLLEEGLNKVPGIKCNPAEGAMYLFPSLTLSEKFIEYAISQGFTRETADAAWVKGLVEEKGVVLVPGSGFEQVPGTYHFRITILPPEDQIQRCVEDIASYQASIHKKFA